MSALFAATMTALTDARRLKYSLAAELFGFTSEQAAKDFAARRHLETWVRDATRTHRLWNLAGYFGRGEQLEAAEKKCAEAAAVRENLGLPPVAHLLRQKSAAALLRDAFRNP